ncbi:MAG: cell surface protein SprA [Candidatus Latescibacteria bacterium]|nr:cell surface protein SprA [Candidatus Latescibacterota bacterium]
MLTIAENFDIFKRISTRYPSRRPFPPTTETRQGVCLSHHRYRNLVLYTAPRERCKKQAACCVKWSVLVVTCRRLIVSLGGVGVILLVAAICSASGLDGAYGSALSDVKGSAFLSRTLPSACDIDHRLLKEEIRFDSSLQRIQLSRSLNGSLYGWPIRMTVEDFAAQGLKDKFMEQWQKRRGSSVLAADETSDRRRGALKIEVPIRFPKLISRFTGEGSSISVTGSRKISFSGRSEWTEGQVATAASRVSKFPALNMQQDSRFTVEGTIGDRITVQIDQDSHKESDLENNIKIIYNGDEDGIVHKVEAGNTSLSLPGTRFVGFSAQHKGLFGVRSEGKLGSIDMTVIASQEKSSGQRKQFKGQTQESSEKIRDYEYKRNTYLFLDKRYRDRFRDLRDVGIEYVQADSILGLRVYIDDLNINNDAEKRAIPGKAYYDLADQASGRGVELGSGRYHEGSFHELDPTEYWFDPRIGYLVLGTPIQDRYILAVAYRTAGGEPFGDVGVRTDLLLKLIKSENQRPDHPTWELMWRNVYDLGARNITPDGFSLKVVREISGSPPDEFQNGVPYLQIVGLDRRDKDGRPMPDNLVDLDPWVDLDRGELIFPDLTPFDPQSSQSTLTDPAKIYESHDQRTLVENSKYLIEIKTQTRQTRFNLGAFGGLVEDSEEVILNGKRLAKGKDYTIDYMTGDISFRGDIRDEVQSPTADLIVNYDTSPLFAFAAQQKSLLGVSSSYKFWGNSEIGSLLLYNNQRSPDKRVRVGQEPSRGVVWDGNAKFRFKPDLFTRAVDALPFVETAAPSRLDLSAEVAQSLPNPNTRGEAYIDDFEGSGNFTGLSIFRGQWGRASVPDGKTLSTVGDLLWYNPFDKIPKRSIWPNAEVSARDNTTDILVLKFDPTTTGRGYRGVKDPRRDPEPDGPVRDGMLIGPVPGTEIPEGQRPEAWGGIVRALGGADFSRSKFLEVWVRGKEGILNIDLGAISEDVIPNDVLDTEDRLRGGVRDGLLQVDEDVGMDGLPDRQESEGSPTPSSDPHGDNWRYESRNDYTSVNGTEKNKDDGDRGTRPDTEDLNNSGFLDRQNAYYTYTMDLAHEGETLVPGTEYNGWRLFRIPLKAYVRKVGRPDSTNVEFARLWVTGVSKPITMEIARIEVVGNDWIEDKRIVFTPDAPPTGDEVFDITVKNTTQNVDYVPPPDVKIQIRRDTGVREPEQSLVLKFAEIKPGQRVSASRTFLRQENYTDYTRLRMHVAGRPDSTAPFATPDTTSLEMFVRFGADSSNYYEYRTPVYPDWDRRNRIDIDLEFFSNLKGWLLKAQVDSISVPSGVRDTEVDTLINGTLYTMVVDETGRVLTVRMRQGGTIYTFPSMTFSSDGGMLLPREVETRTDDGKIYRARGNPAVSTIKTLTVGIGNAGAENVGGEVWVDELRLDSVRKNPGVKAGLFLDAGFADLLDLGATVSWQSENFRDLRSIGGAGGSTERSASLRADVKLDNAFPEKWGLSMPVSVSLDRSSSLPRLRTGSDIILTPDQKIEERTERTRRTVNVSFRKSGNDRSNILTALTLNRMNASFSATDERGRTPQRPESQNLSYSGSFSYDMSPRGKHGLKPLGWLGGLLPKWVTQGEFHYLPSRLSYSSRLNRNWSKVIDLDRNRRNPRETTDETYTLSQNYDAKLTPFQSLSLDYRLSTRNDLRDRTKVNLATFSLGMEVDRTQSVDASLNLNIFQWLRQNYTFDADYHENNDPRLRRRSRSGADTVLIDLGRAIDRKATASA